MSAIRLFRCAMLCMAVFICTAPALYGGNPRTVAQSVLDRLYAANGNYRFKKPTLVVSSENKKVAAYSPWKNTITLDEKAYAICRSFGRDSLAALGFILGHELVHAYQAELKGQRTQTNFLAYHHHYQTDVRIEKVADIQGVFNAYLAGYGVLNAMPDVIERIYRDYGLLGKTLPGYPSLDERKSSSREVLTIVENLRAVFESCNYLLAIGQTGPACSGYTYILQYYQGLEIYNNLGIAYALNAQKTWNPKTDNFLYPLEADWYTKLSRSEAARGQETIDPAFEPLRTAYLEKSAAYFREAALLSPGYLTARINLVCVLNMLGRPAEALQYAESNLLETIRSKKKNKGHEAEMAEIALGITYALQPAAAQKSAATAIFKRLSASPNPLAALYGQQNLRFMNGEPTSGAQTDIPLPESLRQAAGQLQLGRTGDLERILIDETSGIRFAQKPGSDFNTFVFSNSRGNLVSLLRKNHPLPDAVVLSSKENLASAAFRNIVPGKDGFFLKSARDKVVLKVNARGRVLEMVKYVEHGQ